MFSGEEFGAAAAVLSEGFGELPRVEVTLQASLQCPEIACWLRVDDGVEVVHEVDREPLR